MGPISEMDMVGVWEQGTVAAQFTGLSNIYSPPKRSFRFVVPSRATGDSNVEFKPV